MKCPVCGVWTMVTLTRQTDQFVRRSRVCGNEHRFTTEERAVPDSRQRLTRTARARLGGALLDPAAPGRRP